MNKENKKNQVNNKSAVAKSASADKSATAQSALSSSPQPEKNTQKVKAKSGGLVDKPTVEGSKSEGEQSPKLQKTQNPSDLKLSGLYAFKLAMSSLYDEKGRFVPVTFLQVKPWVVSQIKRKEKEGYNSVQVACMPQKNNRCSKSLKTHLIPAGFAGGARYIREIRQNNVDNIEVGQSVSIHSLQKGDTVKVCAISKGHGFSGVVKRWDFKGGPASHGAKTHRSSGSIGNRTEPARVMPGKKMAGHYGVEKTTLKNVQVMDIVSDKNLIVLKGPVPGARNSLVFLSKMSCSKN